MDLKELEKLIKMLKRQGVEHFSQDEHGVSFSISKDHISIPPAPKDVPSDPKPPETESPSEEELLFWSSGGILPSNES